MENNVLFLVSHNGEKNIVSAKSADEALDIWLDMKQDELDEDGNPLKFNPRGFKFEELHKEQLIMRTKN